MKIYDRISETVRFLESKLTIRPSVAIIFGSGLDTAAALLEKPKSIPFSDIPHFHLPTVAGHKGRLWAGKNGKLPLAILSGRSHYYEGLDLQEITLPIRALALWGVRILILTNAAGGIRADLAPGDLMLITDHLNLMGENPLRGETNAQLGPRFVNMSRVYDPELTDIMAEALQHLNKEPKKGVYAALPGPSYETPAEVRMLAALGADAVGMSTVPEAIVARQMNLRLAAVSCITNLAGSPDSRGHNRVLEMAAAAQNDLLKLFESVMPDLGALL